MDLEGQLDHSMMKHCYFCRLYQCLQIAFSVIDEVVDQLEEKNDDPAMLAVSEVVNEETMKSMSEKLMELSNKVHKAACDIKDEMLTIIQEDKDLEKESEEEDTTILAVPKAKRRRTS